MPGITAIYRRKIGGGVADWGTCGEARGAGDIAYRILWQRSQSIDAVEDEGVRYLDMARLPRLGSILTAGARRRMAPEPSGRCRRCRSGSGAHERRRTRVSVGNRRGARRALVGGGAASRPGSVIAFRARAGRRPVLASVTQWGAWPPRGRGGLARLHARHGCVRHDGAGRPGSDDGVTQDPSGRRPPPSAT